MHDIMWGKRRTHLKLHVGQSHVSPQQGIVLERLHARTADIVLAIPSPVPDGLLSQQMGETVSDAQNAHDLRDAHALDHKPVEAGVEDALLDVLNLPHKLGLLAGGLHLGEEPPHPARGCGLAIIHLIQLCQCHLHL